MALKVNKLYLFDIYLYSILIAQKVVGHSHGEPCFRDGIYNTSNYRFNNMSSDKSDDSANAIALIIVVGSLPGTSGDEMYNLEHVHVWGTKQHNFRAADLSFDTFFVWWTSFHWGWPLTPFQNVALRIWLRSPRRTWPWCIWNEKRCYRKAWNFPSYTHLSRTFFNFKREIVQQSWRYVQSVGVVGPRIPYSFIDIIMNVSAKEDLRTPSEEGLKGMLAIFWAGGFSGCANSWECQQRT